MLPLCLVFMQQTAIHLAGSNIYSYLKFIYGFDQTLSRYSNLEQSLLCYQLSYEMLTMTLEKFLNLHMHMYYFLGGGGLHILLLYLLIIGESNFFSVVIG